MSTHARRVGSLLRNVEFSGDCWLWTAETRQGYAYMGGKPAHRTAYELLVGPIPEGLELDHLCRTPACIFPDHLEPVTRAENMQRRAAAQTHCKRGHEFTPANTRLRSGTTTRICRTCQRAAVKRYRDKRGAAA